MPEGIAEFYRWEGGEVKRRPRGRGAVFSIHGGGDGTGRMDEMDKMDVAEEGAGHGRART